MPSVRCRQTSATTSSGSCRRRRRSSFSRCCRCCARRALHENHVGVSPRACLAALVGLTLLSYLFLCDLRSLVLSAVPASGVSGAVRPAWQRQFAGSRRTCRLKRGYRRRRSCARRWRLFGINIARNAGVFDVAVGEGRYVRAANAVASLTPADAIVLSVQHSGSVRYYANRITLRYDWLQDDALDTALRDLTAKRLPRLSGRRRLGRERVSQPASRRQTARDTSWAPIARVNGQPEVRIFELQDGGPVPIQ